MEQMPEHKENQITLWRDGRWVQVQLSDMPRIIEEDNQAAMIPEETTDESKDSSDVPVGA